MIHKGRLKPDGAGKMVVSGEPQKQTRYENKETINSALPPRSKSVLKPYDDDLKKHDVTLDKNNSRYEEDYEDPLPK